MTEKFCKDCPALKPSKIVGIEDMFCRLLPEAAYIANPNKHHCYTGRQIMEKENTWNALRKWYHR